MSLFGTILKQGAKYADSLLDDVAIQAKYVDEEGNVIPIRSRKPVSEMTPEEHASHRAWARERHKARQDEINPNRRVRQDVKNMSPEEREAWNQERLRKKREAEAARRSNMTPEQLEQERIKNKKWREENREEVLRKKREHREDNLEDIKRRQREAYEADKEARKKKARDRRAADPEAARARDREYYKNNKGIFIRNAREREGMIKEQTPAHFNPDAVNEIYRRAQELTEATGQQYVVDHVVPLKGHVVGGRLGDEASRSVSGLNVQDNLLIVPYDLNAGKGAWMDPGDDPLRINEVNAGDCYSKPRKDCSAR